MALAQPRSDLPPVHDPTRDPESHGSPPERRRYWAAAAIGVVGIVVVIALFVWFASGV